MTLDQLISHLQALRVKHGGDIPMMLGQSNPENKNLWSGVEITTEVIRESVFQASFTSVPGHDYKAGWIWFQIPDEGIKHRFVSPD